MEEATVTRAETKAERAQPSGAGLHQLYRHWDADGTLLYVGISLSAVARLAAHRRNAAWYAKVASITIENFRTRKRLEAAEREAIRTERPLHNVLHARSARVVVVEGTLFMSPEELRKFTGYRRHGKQAARLLELGVSFRTRTDGTHIVMYSDAYGPEGWRRKKTPPAEPNFAAIRGEGF